MYTLKDLIEFNKANYLLEFQGGTCCHGDPAYGAFFQQTWESAWVRTVQCSRVYKAIQ